MEEEFLRASRRPSMKNKSKLNHFQMVRCLPDATQLVSILTSIRFSRCACAGSRSDRAARQGDILPDREALGDVNSTLHKVLHNTSLSIGNRKAGADLPHVSDETFGSGYMEIGHL